MLTFGALFSGLRETIISELGCRNLPLSLGRVESPPTPTPSKRCFFIPWPFSPWCILTGSRMSVEVFLGAQGIAYTCQNYLLWRERLNSNGGFLCTMLDVRVWFFRMASPRLWESGGGEENTSSISRDKQASWLLAKINFFMQNVSLCKKVVTGFPWWSSG